MNRPRRYALLILVLSTLLAIGLLFPALLVKTLIEPVATLAWAAWRLIASVDQAIYWIVVITLCLVTMIRLVPPAESRAVPADNQQTARTRMAVERWQRLLDEASVDTRQQAALRASLAELLAGVITDGEPVTSPIAQRRLAAARQSVPVPAAEYLSAGQSSPHGAAAWLPRWFRPRSRRMNASELHSVDELIRWMEAHMEIQHDQ